jgi:16S rRNA (guanine527-N7)-methyltransferase
MSCDTDRAAALALLDVSRETLERLDVYARLLRRWQGMINLVAPSTLPEIWSRHILDSAQLVRFAPVDFRRWIDLGSGGGLPGLVIAALAHDRIGIETILVESDQRKASFLRTAAREMGLGAGVIVHAARIEQVAPLLPRADVVSARALAPLAKLVALAGPILEKGALGIFPKGETALRELTEWGPPDTFEVTLAPSRTNHAASIAVIRRRVSGLRD